MTGVLSLCDRTGNMVRPWADAGYPSVCVDLQHDRGIRCESGIWRVNLDVLSVGEWLPFLMGSAGISEWAMVFAFPPCTNLAVSGARWFQAKGMDALIEALQVVNACRKVAEASGAPYMIENPVSTLSTYWRKPDHLFDPCEYAGYVEDCNAEAYTKKTCLWTGGGFVMPERMPVDATRGSLMHLMAPSPDRSDRRAETPRGFARAVFLANAKEPHGKAGAA